MKDIERALDDLKDHLTKEAERVRKAQFRGLKRTFSSLRKKCHDMISQIDKAEERIFEGVKDMDLEEEIILPKEPLEPVEIMDRDDEEEYIPSFCSGNESTSDIEEARKHME